MNYKQGLMTLLFSIEISDYGPTYVFKLSLRSICGNIPLRFNF